MLSIIHISSLVGLVSAMTLQKAAYRAREGISEPPPADYIGKDPQGHSVDIREEEDHTCEFDYGSGNVTLKFSIEFDEYTAAANLYDGNNIFEMTENSREGETTMYYNPPSGFESAEGPTKDFEAEFKSVNPFHHLKKKALSYLSPNIRCQKLFDAVMSTPPRKYKKGVEGFLQFLRDTHDERIRKIHAWNEKFG